MAHSTMTDRERKFVDAYMTGQSAAASARSAGYADSCAANVGSKLARREDIKAEIARRRAKIAEKAADSAILDLRQVLQHLSDIATDPDASRSDKIRALDLLGRRYGAWIDRMETTTDVMIDKVERLTDEQLEAMILQARDAVQRDTVQ